MVKKLILVGVILLGTKLCFAVDVTLDFTTQQITTITDAYGWDNTKGTRVKFLESILRRLVVNETAYLVSEKEEETERIRIRDERKVREKQIKDQLEITK